MKRLGVFVAVAACLILLNTTTQAQLSVINNTAQVIDFSATIPGVSTGAYTAAGFQATPTAGQLDSDAWAVTGWSDGALAFGGTRVTASTDYTRGTTSVAITTGGFYAYTGAPGSAANPSFLLQPGGGDFAPGTLTLRIVNNGTTNLTQFAVSYNLFVRNDQGRANSFNFSYSTDDTTYTPVAALDYTSTVAADALGYVQVGTSPSRSTTITGLNIAPGSFFYIRWSSGDVSGSGSRDEFALDDISVTPTFAPATYTWAGPTLGLADYNLPTNWSPARTTPAANDILVINTGFTPTLTNVPTQTIGALLVTNSTSATLTTMAANTLTISGGSNALQVDAASALTLADVNPLKISVASGSTGTVAGLMLFQDSGHRLIGNAASAVTFQNGALFTTAANFTGNAFGTGSAGDGAANSVIFASGSKYIHNGGSSPFGASGNAAVTVFQTGSEANWLTTVGFQASGRTYADLTVGNGSTTVGLSDGGTGNFQFDNLTLKNNSTLTFNGSGASLVTIQGDITSEGAGASSDVALTAGAGGIVLNKAGAQTFSGGGGKTITFNSAATVNTGTTLALARVLVQTDPTTLTVNGALTRTTGYVMGNLQKPFSATGAKAFEVGTANGYSPVVANVTALGITPSMLRVKAVQGNQPALPPATSLKRYWTLTEVGDLTATLTFNYLDPTDIMGNESSYQVTKVEGGTVTRFPSATVDTTNDMATVTGVTNFSDWTLAEPLAPTAASVSISGRVMTQSGAGLGRAMVTLLNTNTNQTRTTQTRGDGSYVFEDVPVGSLYVITVTARRYTFAPATQSFTLNDAMQNVNFIGGRE
ncbi:MAG TPA: carboxypeptidase-like regulatory domain-containing protein [Pyrinomonadaceae bacterium]|jgi:hypothetical protein